MSDMLIAMRASDDVNVGDFTFLHTDDLGSVVGSSKKPSGSITTETNTYYAFGEYRSGTTPPTDHQFTGQKQDDNQLMYYNARYYDKHLGAFISPDPLIPDPTDVASYNRYAYANGNPIKYNDPSGNITVIFQGGEDNAVAETSVGDSDLSFKQLTRQSLNAAGYDENLHGAIHYLTNGDPAIEFAHMAIYEAKMLNPDEPVIVIGYSWGGAAAIELANRLNDAPITISVDLLLTIDPENDMRGPIARTFGPLFGFPIANTHRARMQVPSNVSNAINIFALRATSDEAYPGLTVWNWT